jgi:hypothetical protein
MKSNLILAATMSLLVTPISAQAQSLPGWDIGAEIFHYQYREPEEGVNVKDRGVLFGASLGYTHVQGPWMARLRGSAALGTIDYSSANAKFKDVTQKIGQLEFHLGRDFEVLGGSTLTPFIGVGVRELIDKSGGKVFEDVKGYDRRIRYDYSIAGFDLSTAVRFNRNFTASIQYAQLIGGSSKSYFAEVEPEAPNVNLKFKDGGYGVDASAMINFRDTSGIFSIGPFLSYWDVKQSAPLVFIEEEGTVTFLEPANSTWKIGLRSSYRF